MNANAAYRVAGRTAAVLLLLLPPMLLNADAPPWIGYGEALARAKESGRTVIVDVYTDWCGWCKKMDRNVYADEKVRTYLEEHFETAKLNAEARTQHDVNGYTLTEKEISALHGITGYPATIFLDPEGKTITILKGYVPVERFLPVLEYIAEKHYENTSWDDFLKSREQ